MTIYKFQHHYLYKLCKYICSLGLYVLPTTSHRAPLLEKRCSKVMHARQGSLFCWLSEIKLLSQLVRSLGCCTELSSFNLGIESIDREANGVDSVKRTTEWLLANFYEADFYSWPNVNCGWLVLNTFCSSYFPNYLYLFWINFCSYSKNTEMT